MDSRVVSSPLPSDVRPLRMTEALRPSMLQLLKLAAQSVDLFSDVRGASLDILAG